ncbi:hypothetical protein FNL39_101802 [Nocardia caishijiensis]|uniref:Lantibiotic biosynthesis dehydratase-like protein n=2 Tax=Nocardia caishijiensis TaxID=184756 RepID=A0ABQ6YUZ9_9NOCA|nr:hypothetical protein FNL39_101802 [Nocardia caishijiensis]
MVLDEVWRGLDGVDALSGPQGAPLRRTVKLILDPLVIRPVQHPLCAGSVLDADGVTLLTALVLARSDALRACASWFTVLKQARRALRITEGNAQDLYFQRCFELATLHGEPGADARERAVAVLREVHEGTGGRTTTALKNLVTDPDRLAELTSLIESAWRGRPLANFGARELAAALTELLDASTLAREGDPADAGPLLDELIENRVGTHRGIALWRAHPVHGADDLGLTVHECPPSPAVGATASTATLALPFDRTIYERVFTVLQGSIDRTDLPDLPTLVSTEVARSCSPWGLLDESLRVTAAAGSELALGLSPLGAVSVAADLVATDLSGARGEWSAVPGQDGPEARVPAGAAHRDSSGQRADVAGSAEPGFGSRAHAVVNARWRREAYVLQARRYSVHLGAAVGGPLAAVAAELRTPWQPYLRRLWVRLHGRDVRELAVFDPVELWDLLDGVARSVMLDHRARVKQALTVGTVDIEEARAS